MRVYSGGLVAFGQSPFLQCSYDVFCNVLFDLLLVALIVRFVLVLGFFI